MLTTSLNALHDFLCRVHLLDVSFDPDEDSSFLLRRLNIYLVLSSCNCCFRLVIAHNRLLEKSIDFGPVRILLFFHL